MGGIRPKGRSYSPLGPREEQDDPLGIGQVLQEKKIRLSGSKTHPLWYIGPGRGGQEGTCCAREDLNEQRQT
jgi:hypothetical protein